ncbi:hypothetical protein NLJ89_g749 [Agrocybe chaxingu]|uniref:NAD-dependent epimerase/dehydratase domain-containing protein n=1 Tax=Agrocybe chaxingu TaxID=84603 RepID=A0A9W8TG73_9AGAR|nr:hypothetical protein NLJ89_g749 [Agrocybe chaxingu]
MPTVPQGGKVLVSGANGYVAMWTAKILLERGYRVRGDALTDECNQDGAFDEVVKDVDAIEHMASPAYFDARDPQEILGPAIQGTVGMLKSAVEHAPKVNRIVITSSTAAIMTPNLSEPRVFSEKDWNEASPKEVEELGSKAAGTTVYRASKSLAERAAWEFYNQHKSQVSWDLTVFGPPIHDVASPKSLNSSLQTWYNLVVSESPKAKETLSQSAGWVDVRDTAFAHVLALEKEAAGGERILLTSVNVVNNLTPNPLPSHKLTLGYPEILQQNTILASYDKSKEERILGIKFKTMEETARDTLEDFARRGWCD